MGKAASSSDWKEGFLFLGNVLALDFLNTRPVLDGEPTELLKDFAAILRWFRAAGLLTSEQAASFERQWEGTIAARKATEEMQAFRERLRGEILGWEAGRGTRSQTVNEINEVMASRPMLTKLMSNRTGYSTTLWFEARKPADLFAPLAHSAAILFVTGNHKRVRKCANCALHFRDTSKKGTRRWCSMQICGNRFKVAAYVARQREKR